MSYFLLNLNVSDTYIANTATYIVTANELFHNTSMQIGGTTSTQYLSNYVVNDPNQKVIVFGKNGVAVNSARDVITRGALDISNTGVLEFYVSKGGGTWGDPPDNGEDLFLQYSTDSANWNTITSISASGTSSDKWIHITAKIPEAAKTQPVWLRYYMVQTQGSLQLNDQWAVSSLAGFPAQTSNSLSLDASANTEILYNNKGIIDGSNSYYINTTNRFGFGVPNPQHFMHVGGNAYFAQTLLVSAGNSSGNGIRFYPDNPGDGAYDTAWIRYYAYSGEKTNLEISIENDVIGGPYQDSINLRASGGVGVNKQTPAYTLDVNGSVAVGTILVANGSTGLPGQVLTSSGNTSNIYWAAASGGTGLTGYNGSAGQLGFQGSAGFQGSLGFTGSVGPSGPTGGVGKPSRSQRIVSTGVSSYSLNELAPLPENIFVIVNGLVLLPGTDYSVNGNIILFTDIPPSGSDIEIRYFDIVAPTGYRGSEGFKGSVGFTGSIGLSGQPGFNGSTGFTGCIGFTGSVGYGYTGSKGDPTGFTGSAGAGRPVGTQIFAGTGNASYSLNRVVNDPIQVMIMVNGLVQLPVVDYNVSGSTLTFTAGSIPNNVSDIEVLYFNDTPLVGFQGSAGFLGSVGFTGSVGLSGFSGSKGFNGSIGQTGFTGSSGNLGYTGSFGYTGSQGIPGAAADKGYTGSKGDPGPAGGYTGSIGSGFTGSKGDLGYTGSLGPQGNLGYTGSSGASVYQGYTGSKGDIGFSGSTGAVGAPDYSQKIISTGAAAYLLDRSVQSTNHIIVSVNGLVQVPDNDYQVAGTTITFTNPPNSSSDIEIRYFSISTVAGYRGSAGFRGSVGESGYKGSVGINGIANVYIGPNADPNPFDGELWFDTDNGILSIFSQSANTWVGIGPGLRGASGFTGSAGGPPGYTGSAGAGFAGSSGPGYTGSTGAGYTGSIGVGYTGSQGNIGPMGPAGPGGGYAGSKGDMGPAGLGYTGSVGATGPAGPKGYDGSVGIGFTGSSGGPLGYTGSMGLIGYTGSAGTGGGGAGLGSRQTITIVGPYQNHVCDGSIAAAKTYILYNVTVNGSHNVWIRIYDSIASSSADISRTIGQDPGYNSGVVAELISSSATTATTKFTPGVIGMNNNPIISNMLYFRINDLSGTAASVNMTLSILPLEV